MNSEYLTILFDADDTVENLLECWVAALNKRYGTTVVKDDVRSWDISQAFPTLTREQVYSVFQTDELWQSLQPIPGSIEVLQRLRAAGHRLYMVTASDYRTCKVKMERLFEIFPFLDWGHVIITRDKQMVRGDILIDDAPHNLIGGDYYKILFEAPHNRTFPAASWGMTRAKTWAEVELAVDAYWKVKKGEI